MGKNKRQRAAARKRAELANGNPTAQPSNAEAVAQVPKQETQPKSVIPDAPVLSALAREKMADPLLTHKAHGVLDWSEGRGDSGYEAHARGMHSGLSDGALDARGKSVATSFLSDYDQDKAYSSVMATSEGRATRQKATTGPSPYAHGDAEVSIWDANADKQGGKNARGYRTAPLARVAKLRPDGTYDHFNAKVNDAYVKHKRDGTGARVQTLYPSDYERLEAPSNPAEMPEHVELDSIEDTGKLRHVEPEVKDSSPKGRVLTDEEVAARNAPKSEAPAQKPLSKAARRRANRRARQNAKG